ncbi:MAG: cysteine hydrolase [Clostridiales bacterium]|nr:cysteine hydrolase [Clostridiales bacterium]
MRKILIVVDMQNDFIDGALGTPEAAAIVENVKQKIASYPEEDVFFTRDTHQADYMETQEGRYLPVPHCIEGTDGWQIRPDILAQAPGAKVFNKPTFGSTALAEAVKEMAQADSLEIELIGLCTDICVVSNALLLKAALPEVKISVDPACCAGVTPEKHDAALETMRSCQIQMVC